MLPQNYQVVGNRYSGRTEEEEEEKDDDDSGDGQVERRRRTTPPSSLSAHRPPPQQPQRQQPPLGVTGVLCDTNSLLIRGRGTLQYTVFRPRYVQMKPPLICIAGGPYLPWQYLSTLVHLVNDRSLVFFDPIGCGQSKRIEENKDQAEKANTTASFTDINASVDSNAEESLPNNNPVPDMVHDLVHLVQHLQLKHYHLYGHSFGGIVAYEALASREMPATCLSLTLSSTPASLPIALEEIDQLKAHLAFEAQSSLEDPEHAVSQLFAERHECRVRPLPLQLQQSFAMAGFSSSPAGWQSVKDYVVEAPTDDNEKLRLPLLLVRGEFDFISNECMEPWWDCAVSQSQNEIVTIPNVAHYGMLEDEQAYGSVIREFLARVPEPALQIPRPGPSAPSQRRARLPR